MQRLEKLLVHYPKNITILGCLKDCMADYSFKISFIGPSFY